MVYSPLDQLSEELLYNPIAFAVGHELYDNPLLKQELFEKVCRAVDAVRLRYTRGQYVTQEELDGALYLLEERGLSERGLYQNGEEYSLTPKGREVMECFVKW